MPDLSEFTIGPPEPVTDSRQLPVITAEDEGTFVTGIDLDVHPDNAAVVTDADLVDVLAARTAEEEMQAEDAAGPDPASLPGEDEVAVLVTDVDTDAVDEIGFGAEELGFVGLDEDDSSIAVQGGER